jgi:thiol-disulfide isomerase/thioredoxin
MDWSAFRTSHLSEYGSTSREQLSKDYQKYKRSLKNPLTKSIRSPPKKAIQRQSPKTNQFRQTSPVRQSTQIRQTSKTSPVRQIKSIRQLSPVRNGPSAPVRNGLSAPVRQSVKQSAVKNKKMTLKDIETMAEGKKFLIVVLYGDFCGHCRDMKDKLGNKMKNTEKLIFVEANNMDEELKDYFPHVMYYENGERQKDLTVDNIYDYLSV